jgi:2-C-methyl-D-erythritol 4-phosphate cytidylyltransferase
MKPTEQQSVIIVAGGKGLRAGGEFPKQFQLIGGLPVLMHTIAAFHHYNPEIISVVVLPEGFESHWEELVRTHNFTLPHSTVTGGETRFHSVRNGLELIPAEGLVAVHDAARPLVTRELIGRCFKACDTQQCGVIPVVRESASVRLLTDEGSHMIDRELLRLVQTPQLFPAAELKKAYQYPYDPAFTDDASVAERQGLPILLIEGEESNIKITTPFDFLIAEQLLLHLPK